MTPYVENEYTILRVSLFVTTEIAFMVGLMTHVFIIAVNIIDWRKGRPMSTSDQVIISIMVSRMILQSNIQLTLFWKIFCVMCSPIYGLIIRIINSSTIYSSIWLSTLLCVVFYLKISNVCSVFFLRLRRCFSKGILRFIIASLLVSIGQTSVIYLVYYIGGFHIVLQNSTHSYASQPNHTSFVMFFGIMFAPLLIYFLSSLFLITSLYLHIKQMRCNGNMTSSLNVYYRIIRYMIGSLLTSVLYIIINVIVEKYYYMFGFIMFSFPWTIIETLHSTLLIYVTPKLKNPLYRILKYFSKSLTKREDPRDSAMTITT